MYTGACMRSEDNCDSVSEWLHRLESIGPGSLLVAIESRMGEALARHVSPEDIYQEAMLSLCQAAERLEWRGHAAFRSWLLTVIDHRIADAARNGVRSPRPDPHPFPHGAPGLVGALAMSTTPSRLAVYREQAEAIRAALRELPEDLREIVRARVIDQRPLREVAESMGLSVGVVRHRFRVGAELYTVHLRRALVTTTARPAPES